MNTVTSPQPRVPARHSLLRNLARPPRRAPRRTPAQRQLLAAAACTAFCVVVSALWACYVLAHLGDPAIAGPRDQLANLPLVLPTAAAGMLLHAHRPGSPLGWVMLAYATVTLLPLAAAAPVPVEVTDSGLVATVTVVRALSDAARQTLFYVLPLWLPSGRLTDRRWWWYVAATALWSIPWNLAFLARPTVYGRPNPLADNPLARAVDTLTLHIWDSYEPVHYALLGVSTVLLLTRMRRSGRGHRLHVAGMLGAYLLYAGAELYYVHTFRDHYWFSYSVFAAAGCVWSGAVAHLVIRDGGWRLDRAARQVLVALLLGTGFTAVFVVLAAVLSAWLVPGRGAAALLLIALVFALGTCLPRAARWVVGVVDRLYYGDRAQPYLVLSTLAGRVRQVVDPDQLPVTLCTTVAEELRLPGVALTVTTRAGQRPLAGVGRLDGRTQDFALVHHGTPIGRLTVGLRAGEEQLDDSDLGVLRSLADQASPAVASLRLQEDLQASREQIVAAREEERRRLRRDIHDGLGPALAGLRLRVDNAASGVLPPSLPDGTATPDGTTTAGPADGAALADTLRGISDGLAMAIKEVRRITDRLGPAPLGEFGLACAIRQLGTNFSGAGLSVTTDLTPDPLPDLPAAVEVAVYRITAEALNNVLRHAGARHAKVTLRVDEAALTLTVQDDGRGYRPPPRAPEHDGVGLRSMADRAAEIGGHCTVEPRRREPGTLVLAVLPRHPAHD